MKNSKIIRADRDWVEEIVKDIIIGRIRNGMDEDKKSIERITLAIRRHHLWEEIKKDIINAELKNEK